MSPKGRTVSTPNELSAETKVTNATAENPVPARAAAASSPARPAPTPESQQLVQGLTKVFQPGSPITAENAGAFRQQLQQLVQQGASGIPAILEFLAKNQDEVFSTEQSQAAGYASVRGALMDALRQIGGPEGIAGMLEVIHTTGDPHEILALARNLDAIAPDEYRSDMIEAARQTLAMARQGQLEGYDVAAVFEVLRQFGGSDAIVDFQQASGQWKYYAAIGLAQLPDGAGIPTLIQMANDSDSRRGIALEMLAQVATVYPEARAALVAQVRAGNIEPNLWPFLGAVLMGDHYQFSESTGQTLRDGQYMERVRSSHIQFGNQNLYQGAPPGGFTPEQLNQQLAFVNELLGAASNPDAQRELTRAQAALNARLNRLSAAPTP